MAFNFGDGDSSSDNDGAGDISAWKSGAMRQRPSPPRRTSGFQAVNQPVGEDIAMESSPEPAPAPAPAPAQASSRVPVAQMVPATEPTVISSGEESSSEEDGEVPNLKSPSQPEEAGDARVTSKSVNSARTSEAKDQEYESASEDGKRFDWSFGQSPEQPHELDTIEEDELHVPHSSLEVVIPGDELDEEERQEYEDFTAGGDVVLRVMNEMTSEDGMMEYTVEFEDRHVEQVSFMLVIAHDRQGCILLSSSLFFTFSLPQPRHRLSQSTDTSGRFHLPTCFYTRTARKHSTTSNLSHRQDLSLRPRPSARVGRCLLPALELAHLCKRAS